MDTEQNLNTEEKNLFKRIWESIVASHHYAIIVIIVVSGIEILYKRADESGIIAIITLAIALFVEMGVIIYFETKHNKERKNLTTEISELEQRLANNLFESEKKMANFKEKILELEQSARYLNFFKHLNQAFAELRRAEREEKTFNNEQNFITAFKEFCNSLNTAFHEVTGKEYHICIKIIVQPTKSESAINLNKLKNCTVQTFIRDGNQLSKRAEKDLLSIPHVINKNSDFNQIVDNWNTDQSAFFCNDLIDYKGYTNTRFIEFFKRNKNEYERATPEERDANWKLFYKSTITSAIGIIGKNDKGTKSGTIIGFLCIDASEKHVFNEDIDPLIISGCAEALYNPLLKFLKIYHNNSNGKTNSNQISVSAIKN